MESKRTCSDCGIRPVIARGLCARDYAARNKAGTLPPLARRDEIFWTRVNPHGPVPSHVPDLGPCWLWTGKPSPSGYGRFSWMGRGRQAHAVSWMISRRKPEIPTGLEVCHRCDVRACVRPSHLFVGDRQANVDDMVAKGRVATGQANGQGRKTHCPKGHPYDEENTAREGGTGYRKCKTCHREAERRAFQEGRRKIKPKGRTEP